ncbi:hypothetical protein L3073_01500 [Ancylomarina sp. DW003]|nr:hypothetical protein [Ancylomarina sp. DW003]MDE5420876.1 hypothetical protein [Ancylomarina sp. DW003]
MGFKTPSKGLCKWFYPVSKWLKPLLYSLKGLADVDKRSSEPIRSTSKGANGTLLDD